MNDDYVTKRFKYFIPKKDKDLRKVLEDSNWNFQLQLIRDLQQENEQLKSQLEYLRSGEYYNQLRFERDFNEQYVEDLTKENKLLLDDRKTLFDENSNKEYVIVAYQNKLNRLKDELVKDKMEQFDDYIIYLLNKYIDILDRDADESNN